MTTSDSIPESDDELGYPHGFGPYALLCALGRGGMGAVHLAKLGSVAGIEKYCVVKTLRKKHVDNEEYITRFMDEARLVVHLGHRNICPIFDVGRVGQKYYLAMELIEGRDLHTLVEKAWRVGQPLAPALALHFACEVLEALDYAHRRTHPVTGERLDIVHRDVSPHNVMVNFEGEVKLIDFGLAASSLKVERTDPKIVLGKLSYMSREHLRAQPVDARHDLFGVAVMLYEMLAGERYYADVPQDCILPLLAEGTHVPRRLASFDAELRGILGQALASDVKRRTGTCGELRDQLQQYMLRRQLGAGARDLRELMDALFPGEQGTVRALLQRFQDVQPPARAEDQSTVIARAGASSGKIRVLAADDRRSQSVPVVTGSPITEPTGRIDIPAPFLGMPTTDHTGGHDATMVVPRAAAAAKAYRSAASKPPSRAAIAAIASVFALLVFGAAAAGWHFWKTAVERAPVASASAVPSMGSLPAGSSSSSRTEPEEKARPPEEKARPPEEKARPPEAAPPKTAAEPPPEAVAAAAPSAPSKAAATKKPRKASPRRAPRRPPAAAAPKPPPLPKGATPEEKVRYLDSHCGAQPCARPLVERFRAVGLKGMTTDEVRAFWPRVNRCLKVCSN